MSPVANGSTMDAGRSTGPAPRPHFVAVTDLNGWRLKIYQVAAGRRLRPGQLGTIRSHVKGVLPERPDLDGAYGVGFVIVQDGQPACLTLVDWWVRPDELHQRAFIAPTDRPQALVPLLTAAVGRMPSLAVVSHEHLAWLRNVLDRPAGPDIEGYLADVLN